MKPSMWLGKHSLLSHGSAVWFSLHVLTFCNRLDEQKRRRFLAKAVGLWTCSILRDGCTSTVQLPACKPLMGMVSGDILPKLYIVYVKNRWQADDLDFSYLLLSCQQVKSSLSMNIRCHILSRQNRWGVFGQHQAAEQSVPQQHCRWPAIGWCPYTVGNLTVCYGAWPT